MVGHIFRHLLGVEGTRKSHGKNTEGRSILEMKDGVPILSYRILYPQRGQFSMVGGHRAIYNGDPISKAQQIYAGHGQVPHFS